MGAVCAGLTAIPLAVRHVLGMTSQQFGWLPAITVAAAGAPAGLDLAPYPGVESSFEQTPGQRDSLRKRARPWMPSLSLLVTVVSLLALAWFTHLPSQREAALAAAVLLASMLLPVPPFDGARIASRRIHGGITLVLCLFTGLIYLKWI